ncbi:MAG: pseudouridine-5-phosphate glycosidase [Firmicutes bacterium HGW-Firmicutes-13]|nr:MAG: pseudouridine-5-phosphate glycosidase [Firmicutes bacterium HGW-Firmicutes-13]
MKDSILINPDIEDALSNKKPVVTLESSFIAHGLPYPSNLELVLEMLDIIEKHSVIPAVTAVINGKIRVGLEKSELEEMAKAGKDYFKAAAGDFGALLAKGAKGATTVAGTIFTAHLAGIKICVTGGIGGVHRDVSHNFDISQDLTVLSKYPVSVVSAGAKAILDISLTLEYLETIGVPIVGYRTKYFPSFYSRTSPYELDHTVESSGEAAKIIKYYERLGWQGGLLIATPLPDEESLSEEFIDSILEKALTEAKRLTIRRKHLTPYLLNYLSENSGGKCLKANISLLKNNARLAAEISLAYYQPTLD